MTGRAAFQPEALHASPANLMRFGDSRSLVLRQDTSNSSHVYERSLIAILQFDLASLSLLEVKIDLN